jgi:hypothetical protein
MQIEQSNSRVIRESVIARSPAGHAVVSFDTTEQARRYVERNPNLTVKLFQQTLTETEI